MISLLMPSIGGYEQTASTLARRTVENKYTNPTFLLLSILLGLSIRQNQVETNRQESSFQISLLGQGLCRKK
jgi:hypothetical protein